MSDIFLFFFIHLTPTPEQLFCFCLASSLSFFLKWEMMKFADVNLDFPVNIFYAALIAKM